VHQGAAEAAASSGRVDHQLGDLGAMAPIGARLEVELGRADDPPTLLGDE
jgi:hypothetical protein